MMDSPWGSRDVVSCAPDTVELSVAQTMDPDHIPRTPLIFHAPQIHPVISSRSVSQLWECLLGFHEASSATVLVEALTRLGICLTGPVVASPLVVILGSQAPSWSPVQRM